jgi:hypothetical protein
MTRFVLVQVRYRVLCPSLLCKCVLSLSLRDKMTREVVLALTESLDLMIERLAL